MSKISEMYEKLKANVIECVVWAERELSGKSGAEKKAGYNTVAAKNYSGIRFWF